MKNTKAIIFSKNKNKKILSGEWGWWLFCKVQYKIRPTNYQSQPYLSAFFSLSFHCHSLTSHKASFMFLLFSSLYLSLPFLTQKNSVKSTVQQWPQPWSHATILPHPIPQNCSSDQYRRVKPIAFVFPMRSTISNDWVFAVLPKTHHSLTSTATRFVIFLDFGLMGFLYSLQFVKSFPFKSV